MPTGQANRMHGIDPSPIIHVLVLLHRHWQILAGQFTFKIAVKSLLDGLVRFGAELRFRTALNASPRSLRQ